ncbi:two-component system, chemotaxis family, sensor kinase CheA [Desulfosarcina sp. BuS5]|uniref:hybrid sensor histidine kinase/response regulator n=1 Tax=Desulfosarcina sp. BuS5 TaxID=933262 RepID=UPI0006842E5C|nr:hybrid sensor histidine kinase/response regulator [Desulfosarcina sp. BuS5]WDN88154.1 two-component system, chemotaxis family, sensor kinase CheA [Desulfosarcina sp. BuS5]
MTYITYILKGGPNPEQANYGDLDTPDLIHDVHQKNKNPLDVLNEMQQCGDILESKIDVEAVGDLEEGEPSTRLPFLVLFATILKPDDINALFEIDEEHIYLLAEDLTIRPLSEPEPAEQEEVPPVIQAEPAPVEAAKEAEPAIVVKAVKKVEPASGKAPQKKKAVPPKNPVVADTSLRVHVSLLDSLMTLAGELVLSRNQLLQSGAADDKSGLESACQRIDMITSELQEAIMKTRMQAVGNVFSKFPRVVRDLARNLGKEIELEVEGQEVELDKTIIEGIGDPLTHLVRNSVDHGIETPDVRRKAGKETTGRVELRAFHEAGQVNIEIRDDGKGLDGNKLAGLAIDKGLLTEDQATAMSDKEKMNLIFMPGFSTAKEVTDVSGRGVGMDVVKTNLDKLGGVVDIDSEVGKGTIIRIKLPLTLAIIPSQLISAGGERYAIPQVNMEELLRIPAAQVKDRIEKVGDAEVVRLRGNLLPLIKLADVIGIESIYTDSADGLEMPDRRQNIADRRSKKSPEYSETSPDEIVDQNNQPISRASSDRRYHADSALNIVVVSTGTMKYGLVVDSLHDSEEIVVKPLGRHLKHCKGYAGATIMGDGRVALILDVAGLSRMAELNSVEVAERASEVHEEELKTGKDIQSLLMFRNAEDEQFSVPLGLVSRIEKIKRDTIEEVGGKRVMQYREMSLPLLSIEDVAAVKPVADIENLLVIVFTIAGKEMGLLATSPVDAADVAAAFDDSTLKQTGIMGSAIIDGCTTQMVDIFELVETMHPEWFEEREVVQTEAGEAATILYAEDSNFFRTQVKGFLKEEGYNVTEAEDGEIAWNLLCERGKEIDLVVTDIEMPNMNGFEFAKKIKQDERFKHLPVIAMTTLAGEEDIAKGREIGIDAYQIKLDKEQLLESIHGYLSK